MEWLVLLSCIIFIEFVKNSKDIKKIYWSALILLRVFWDLKKTFKSRKASRTFLRPLRRPCLENPKGSHWSCLSDKVMCHECHVCHQNCHVHRRIGAQATSFLWSCHLPLSKVSLGFSDGLLALLSLKISRVSTKQLQNSWTLNSDLRVIHHQWRPPDLATFQVSVNCTWNKADLKHWLAGFAGLVLAQNTELAWDFWKFHGVWKVQKIQNSTILKWFRASVENLSIRSFFSNIYFVRKPLWTSSAVSGEKHSRNLIPLSHWWHWQRFVVWDDTVLATCSPQNCSTLAQHW